MLNKKIEDKINNRFNSNSLIDDDIDYDELETNNDDQVNINLYKIENKTNNFEKYNVIFKGFYFFSFVCFISLGICIIPQVMHYHIDNIFTYIVKNMIKNWSNNEYLLININIIWSFIFISLYIIYSWLMIYLIIRKYNFIKFQKWIILLFMLGLGFCTRNVLRKYFYDDRVIISQLNILKITISFQSIYLIFFITEIIFISIKNQYIIYGSFFGVINLLTIVRFTTSKWIFIKLNKLKFIIILFIIFIIPYLGNILFCIYGIHNINKKLKIENKKLLSLTT